MDEWVRRILAESRSAALIGVLLQLGKYKPALLGGSMKPLLGVSEIYSMEQRLRVENSVNPFWSLEWSRYGEDAWNQARDWLWMPHRKILFFDLVMPLILHNKFVRSEFLQHYDQWKIRVSQRPDDADCQHAINQFEVAIRFFQAIEAGGEHLAEFEEWQQAKQKEAARDLEEMNANLHFLTLAPQCRKRIDEHSPFPSGQLGDFWISLLRIAERPDSESGEDRKADAVLGGLALMLRLHQEWVFQDTERVSFCRTQLRSFLDSPRDRRPYDFPESVGDFDAETFAAECGVALLSADRNDLLARRLVLSGLVSFRYATVEVTMRYAHQQRSLLGIEFQRMKSFVTDWSLCQWILHWASEWRLDRKRIWERECLPKIRDFERGESSIPNRSIAELDSIGRSRLKSLFSSHLVLRERQSESGWRRIMRRVGIRWVIDKCRGMPPKFAKPNGDISDEVESDPDREFLSVRHGVPQTWPGVNPEYLRAGFAWLDAATTETPVTDETVKALIDLLPVTLRGVSALHPTTRLQKTRFPSHFDDWLSERVAMIAIRPETQKYAVHLWEPIVKLGERGQFWVRHFLSVWFRTANNPALRPQDFVNVWRKMICLALDDPNWERNHNLRWSEETIVNDLLGFGMGMAVFGDNEQFVEPLTTLLPEFQRAAERWFKHAGIVEEFRGFCVRPAAVGFLLPAIRWLSQARLFWDNWPWDKDRFARSLVRVLQSVLDRHRSSIESDDDLRKGYVSLCGRLVAENHHSALVLRERFSPGNT